ncbi:MAG: hypothetical protein ACYTEG_09985 [Planctomycetota bacterium]|jgi:hypothetical protein
MIRCTPRGICSWAFELEGEGNRASLEFDWASEQGEIVINAKPFRVRKHGPFSGSWTLERNGEQRASARKDSAFSRAFEITFAKETLTLEAASAFQRKMILESDGEVVATFDPDHACTRRASITTHRHACDFALLCFSFWLTVQMWRRAAKKN